ncbi:hypothetical protein GCM10015535_01960 [Streptomyces gelaticus]|uniref:Uncharacterized protein n=1 Tax=Streptomyces gelaticus TaxID=285446 RepID=A0ABQ2VQ62_9ACTN|nr:hypothetical protein GCM10015535_01960 [Streptomyces gelaticus]
MSRFTIDQYSELSSYRSSCSRWSPYSWRDFVEPLTTLKRNRQRVVVRGESGGGGRALEAAQGHGPPEVDGDVVHGDGEPEPAQGLGAPGSGTGSDKFSPAERRPPKP